MAKCSMFLSATGGLCDDWSHLDGREGLQQLLAKQKVPVLDFPKFSYRERDHLDAKRLAFQQVGRVVSWAFWGSSGFIRFSKVLIKRSTRQTSGNSAVRSQCFKTTSANGTSGEANVKPAEPATSGSKSRNSQRSS